MKKKLVIVILGAKRIDSKFHWLKKVLIFLYNKLGISHLSFYKRERMWKQRFYSKDRDVIYLHWGRGITAISRFFAIRRLERIIHKYKNTHEICLVGYSMGGEVALEAANKFDGIIKKAFLVFSPNEKSKTSFKKTKIINIYSPFDFFIQTAIKVLAPLTGNQKLIGENITNISIDNFEHFEALSDKKIDKGRFRGKTVTELINELI